MADEPLHGTPPACGGVDPMEVPTVYSSDDLGDEGTAGVHEPRRHKRSSEASSLATKGAQSISGQKPMLSRRRTACKATWTLRSLHSLLHTTLTCRHLLLGGVACAARGHQLGAAAASGRVL